MPDGNNGVASFKSAENRKCIVALQWQKLKFDSVWCGKIIFWRVNLCLARALLTAPSGPSAMSFLRPA
jgi:hypothetical protein